MSDLVFIGLTIAFFLIALAYVRLRETAVRRRRMNLESIIGLAVSALLLITWRTLLKPEF
jgi:multisubunit Na+/H+ antiporter MnhB subunit